MSVPWQDEASIQAGRLEVIRASLSWPDAIAHVRIDAHRQQVAVFHQVRYFLVLGLGIRTRRQPLVVIDFAGEEHGQIQVLRFDRGSREFIELFGGLPFVRAQDHRR